MVSRGGYVTDVASGKEIQTTGAMDKVFDIHLRRRADH
jgi:hypothetical protein